MKLERGLVAINPEKEYKDYKTGEMVRVFYSPKGYLPIASPIYVYAFGGDEKHPKRVEYLTNKGVTGLVLSIKKKEMPGGIEIWELRMLKGTELYRIQDFDWYYGTRIEKVKQTKQVKK